MIVNLHWGTEFSHADLPRAGHARAAADPLPGDHAIVGQHVHVVQPIRACNGKPVVFGEGNLVSNQTAACCPAESQDGLIALIDFVADGKRVKATRVRYVPVWVRHPDYKVLPASPRLALVEADRGGSRAPSGNRTEPASGSAAMKIRAAVLEEFAKPLVVQDVELDGPGPGEVLVRLAACGVCHTDLYTASGADPSGYAPTVLGHEGAGVVEAVGEGVTSVAPGDHVVTLFSPQCRECIHCRLRQDQPLPRHPRAAEPGLPARRHARASTATASGSATSWARARSPRPP